MAKAAVTPKTETPAVVSRVAKQVGKFQFTVTKGETVPTNIPRARGANTLPFKELFSTMEHAEELFVPTAFWTAPTKDGGRGVEVEKATTSYQRTKLRDQFKEWRDADESRANYNVVIMPREATDTRADGSAYGEPGLSLFILHGEGGEEGGE